MTNTEPICKTMWKHGGVRVIPAASLNPNTAQTPPGMDRKAAINFARVGAKKIWREQ